MQTTQSRASTTQIWRYRKARTELRWKSRVELGSIEEGKLADMIVIDRNLFEVPVTDIHGTKVLETIRGGQTVYGA